MKQSHAAAALFALLTGLIVLGNADAATATRTSAFEYDPATGLLTKEIVEPDNPQLRLETAYMYDAYGNKTSATVSSPATGAAAIEARTVSTTYDSRGQFPVSSTNALGHSESKVFDPKFGALLGLTGPNGLTTTWQYDSFGRNTREIRADGTQTKWDYLYCNGVNGGTATCPSLAKYLVQVAPLAKDGATANGSWSKSYFDSLGREIQSETVGFDGGVITKRTEYDSLGRVYRVSNPYASGQTMRWTMFSYDAIGRVVTTTAPDNTQTSVDYHGLTTSVTNGLRQTQTAYKNGQGQTVKVTDAASKSITYQYDAFGNLSKTSDPQGNVVTLEYDLRGRKTKIVDPDMGTWTYDYNALGQLIKQTDAKGQVATTTYDKLGRVINRAEPDLVSNWTYDNCSMGVGKLCKATTDNGYVTVPSYDSLGRGAGNSTTIDTTYNTSATYDANGRITTLTYPTGLTVKYVYTSLGFLKEVRNNASDALYWRADSMDAQGHLLQQTYGNGVVTQQVYDPVTSRLKNIYAGAGNGVQNLTFGYDSIGNLQSRNDANHNLAETFLYDALNRLTTATVNSGGAGVVTTNYAYDSIGNITSRSDIGTYAYGPVNNRPHGITEIALAAGGKRQFTYDANGNLTNEVQRDANNVVIPSKGRTEVYTSFNMPQALGAPGISLAFAYGPEHQRVKQIAPTATTIYLHPDDVGGLLYEKDLKANGTIEHRHFISAGGQVVAVVKQVAATTTVRYFHRDQLGSTTAITDEAGAVIERLAYEPFGKRRFPAGTTDPNNTIVGVNTDRGYTNHEHLDELGLIHMNGRIYDPAIGRFMSADPFIQSAHNTQSYNRYAYVMNSPFMLTDPSGFSWKSIATGGVSDLGGKRLNEIASPHRIIYKNVSYGTGQIINGLASSGCGWWAWACAAGGAYENARAHGASTEQAIKAGAVAGISTYANSWIGANYTEWENVGMHMLWGCAESSAGGGSCAEGAAAGGVSAGIAEFAGVKGQPASAGEFAYSFSVHVISGGLAAEITGGSFTNGATTAAFAYLYNAAADHLASRWEAFREARRAAGLSVNEMASNVQHERLWDGDAKGRRVDVAKANGEVVQARVYVYDTAKGRIYIEEHSIGHMKDGKLVETGHFNVRDANRKTLPGTKEHYNFKGRLDPFRFFWRYPNGTIVPRGGNE